jgi:WD40 repeat protein
LSAIAAAERSERLTIPNAELAAQTDATLRQAIFNTVQTNTFNGHEDQVFAIAFSPDGQYLVTGGEDQTIRIWRTDGQLVRTLTAHQGNVRRVVFSPDGQSFASASSDGTAKLWSVAGELQQTFTLKEPIFSLAFSPDGQTLAFGNFQSVQLWQRDGTPVQTFSFPEGRNLTWAVAFSPDGQTVLSGHTGGQVYRWTRQGDRETVITFEQNVNALALTPDGQTIVLGLSEGQIAIVDVESGSMRRDIAAHQSRIWDLTFSPDGQHFASVSQSGRAKLWALDGRELATLQGDTASLLGVAFSPDGEILGTVGQSRQVKLWRVRHPLRTVLQGHQDNVQQAAFHPQGEPIATASTDGTVQLWQRTGERLALLRSPDSQPIWSVQYAPDGSQLASLGVAIHLWQPDGQLQETIALPGRIRPANRLAFSPDGTELAVGLDEQVYFALGARSPLTNAHTNAVTRLAFSPDGSWLATTGDDRLVKLWNPDGTLNRTIKDHPATLNDLSFSPDSQLLATVGGDSFVRLWTVDGTLRRSFRETGLDLDSLGFHPDGELLAVAGGDRAVELWTIDGEFVQRLEAHREEINSVAISPDGRWIVSASNDDTAILWDLDQILTLEPLTYACDWVQDYLRYHATEEEGALCQRDRR